MDNPKPVSIGRGSKKARQGQGGLASFKNFYVEDLGQEGKVSFTAQAINGQRLFAQLGTGSIDGMLPVSSRLLAITGTALHTLNLDGGDLIQVGGVPGSGFITMAVNRKTPDPQVAIVRDGLFHIYSNGSVAQVTDPDLPPPLCVVEILGYFVLLIRDGRWFITSTNSSDVDPLDFAEAEARADKNVMAAVRGRTLIIFGESSIEFWEITGDEFPFAFNSSRNMGCYTAGSVANFLVQSGESAVDTVVWAATDNNGAFNGIYMLNGYAPVRISSDEVERAVRAEPDKASIRSMSWSENEQSWYSITGSSFTFVYSGKTREWHERGSKSRARWNPQCHAHINGRVIFGHAFDGKICESLQDVYDEDGDTIVCRIQPPPIHAWPHYFKLEAVHLDMVTGVGASDGTAHDTDPVVVIDYSKDGGRAWSGTRRLKLGKTGQTMRKLVLRRLGKFGPAGLTLRISCSARVVKALQQMAVNVEILGG